MERRASTQRKLFTYRLLITKINIRSSCANIYVYVSTCEVYVQLQKTLKIYLKTVSLSVCWYIKYTTEAPNYSELLTDRGKVQKMILHMICHICIYIRICFMQVHHGGSFASCSSLEQTYLLHLSRVGIRQESAKTRNICKLKMLYAESQMGSCQKKIKSIICSFFVNSLGVC